PTMFDYTEHRVTRPASCASGARLAMRLAFVLCIAALVPSVARAQAAEQVFSGQDLDTQPKLANPAATARLISGAYPDQLKRAGIGGTAQIQFIIGTNGKVEPGSIEIVVASLPAL